MIHLDENFAGSVGRDFKSAKEVKLPQKGPATMNAVSKPQAQAETQPDEQDVVQTNSKPVLQKPAAENSMAAFKAQEMQQGDQNGLPKGLNTQHASAGGAETTLKVCSSTVTTDFDSALCLLNPQWLDQTFSWSQPSRLLLQCICVHSDILE